MDSVPRRLEKPLGHCRTMRENSEVFIGLDVLKDSHAVAVAESGLDVKVDKGRDQMSEPKPISGRRFAAGLDWNLLRTFHEIAQAGGISNAAKVNMRKQPALSMALKRLEEMLGAVLCHRGPSGFHLTAEGEMLAETCAQIYATITNVPNRLIDSTNEIRGRVRIQTISNLVARSIDVRLHNFHIDYPNVEIFISISPWEMVPSIVMRNDADIGIAPSRNPLKMLKYDILFREKYQLYCGRSHPLFGKHFKNPRDVSSYGLIHTGADEPEQLTRFRYKYGIGKVIAGMSERIEEARRLALLSIGICFLPEAFAESDVKTGKLHPLLDSDHIASSEIFLIYNPDAPRHPARDKLLDLLRGKSTTE